MRWISLVIITLLATAALAEPGPGATAWRFALDAGVASADHGMVAGDEPQAVRIGEQILEAGGNAVDAAVATTFDLAVVLPEAGNIGGGGFAVVSLHGVQTALDFRETAPQAATRDMYLDGQGQPTDRSLTGHLAVGVPGTVAGLWALHQRYGQLPWRELLAPAIRLARAGFPIGEDFADFIHRDRQRLAGFPSSARLFLSGDRPLETGDHWSNPDLAATLERIAEQGARDFYQGRTADLLVAEMRRGDGLISHADLAQYQPRWRQPIRFKYHGYELVTMPPPSSGGITLALILRMLDSHHWQQLAWHSSASIQLAVEAMRRAFAVRNSRLADPDHVALPVTEMMTPSYALRLGESITPGQATPSSEIHVDSGAGDGEGAHTTHLSIVDNEGNAVALTTTINTCSAVAVSDAGFLLNNEMDDFAAKPGAANVFGLVQGEANAIAPGKRPLSSMTPTVVLSPAGDVRLVTGASGGPMIITTAFQIITNVLDYQMPIGPAVRASRYHHQHLPDQVFIEPGGLPAETREVLSGQGYVLKESPWIGRGASIERRGEHWFGVADPRIHGTAEGY